MKRSALLFCLVGLFLIACGNSEVPTPLPTAVPPSGETGTGSWAVAFQKEFPPGFWGPGAHRYAFLIQCPVVEDENISTDWQLFEVSDEAPLQPQPIYLRVQGLSADSFAPNYALDMAINPEQPTIALVYLVGIAEEDVERVISQCEAVIFRDDKGGELLTAGDAFQP